MEAADTKITENQHYVPELLLRNFSVPLNRERIMVFDKHTERTFSANVKKVSAEKGFYNIDYGDCIYTMERSFQNIENTTARILKEIIRDEKLPKPDSDDRCLLSTFVAVQFLRVKAARIRIAAMNDLLKQKFEVYRSIGNRR